MSKIIQFIESNPKVGSFLKDHEAIQALASLSEIWHRYKLNLPDFEFSSVNDFVNGLLADTDLVDALTTLGVDDAELEEATVVVKKTLGRVPDRFQMLLSAVKNYNAIDAEKDIGLFAWAPLDKSTDNTGNSYYTFSLSARAGMEFEAGDEWPIAKDKTDTPLLRIAFNGSIGVSGNATLPFSVGSLSLGTQNSAQGNLAYYYRADPEHIYARAVSRELGELFNPFELDAIWEKAASQSFHGMVLEIEGITAFDSSLRLAKGFDIGGGSVVAPAGVTAEIAMQISRGERYQLIIRNYSSTTAGRMLQLGLYRSSSKKTARSASLSIEVDIAALVEKAHSILESHHGEYKQLLEEYKDYLTPGTYLRSQLKLRIDEFLASSPVDQKVKDLLSEALSASLGESDSIDASRLPDKITDLVGHAIDNVAGAATDKSSVVADRVMQIVGEKINIDHKQVGDVLDEKITEFLGDVEEDLNKKIHEKWNASKQRVTDQLREVGARVKKKEASLNEALAGVRNALSQYGDLLQKIIDVTKNAAKAQVEANIYYKDSSVKNQVCDLSITIGQSTDATRAIYRDLISGNLNSILSLFAGDSSTPIAGITLDKDNSRLARSLAQTKETGFALMLLGFEGNGKTIFSSDSKVTHDGHGSVSVESGATWERKRRAMNKESRSIKFIDAFRVVASKKLPSLSVDFSITHSDQKLRLKELHGFVSSFGAIGLIEETALLKALDIFETWAGSKKTIDAELRAFVTVPNAALLNLLQLDKRVDGDIEIELRNQLFDEVTDTLIDNGAIDTDKIGSYIDLAKEKADLPSALDDVDVLRKFDDDALKDALGRLPSGPKSKKGTKRARLRVVNDFHDLGFAFVDMLETLGDVYQSTPNLNPSLGWTESHYAAAQNDLDGILRKWVKINSFLVFSIRDSVHPQTASFLQTLMTLANRDITARGERARLSIVFKHNSGTGETVLLA